MLFSAKKGLIPLKEPMYTFLPSCRSRTWSNICRTSMDGWWIVAMTILFSSAISRRVLTTFSALRESNPVVGSSKINIFGSVTISEAMAVLFLSPPDTPLTRPSPMLVFAHFSSSNAEMISVTLELSSFLFVPNQ